MANNNQPVRFTDEIYASKQEVSKELNTNLIDPIWSNILRYRSPFTKYLPLKDVSKSPYYIVNSSLIVNKANNLQTKFAKLITESSRILDSNLERYSIRFKMRKEELYSVAKFLKIPLNDVAINNIVEKRQVDRMYAPIKRYFDALIYVDNHYYDDISESSLADLYSILNGEDELTSFYRNSEFQSTIASKALINKEYQGVPYHMVETMMENLLEFISISELSTPNILGIIYYMMNYIKPFEEHNELMTILMMKLKLAKSELGDISSLVPLEYLLSSDNTKLALMIKESQKTRDITYTLNQTSDIILKATQTLLDTYARREVEEARDSFYMGEKEEIEKELNISLDDNKIYDEEEIIYDNSDDKISEKEEIVQKEVKPIINKELEIISTPTITFNESNKKSEKELNIMEEDLLSSDPYLRPAQAHFYVRHCQVGKFYTIQQFKKAEGVVYETARTSMDNLAKRGYYKREQIKNKFVYTPIEKD